MPTSIKRIRTPQSTVADQPEAVATATRPTAPPPERFSRIVERARSYVKRDLKGRFETFIEQATPEEIRFMNTVLLEWETQFHNQFKGPRSPTEREVPIFNAIQFNLNERLLVEVPDAEMVPDVENFIAEMERLNFKREKASHEPRSEEQILDSMVGAIEDELVPFFRDAGKPSLHLLRDVLARWNELHRDPEVAKAIQAKELPNQLAVAIEMEVDTLRARTAAEAAVA